MYFFCIYTALEAFHSFTPRLSTIPVVLAPGWEASIHCTGHTYSKVLQDNCMSHFYGYSNCRWRSVCGLYMCTLYNHKATHFLSIQILIHSA